MLRVRIICSISITETDKDLIAFVWLSKGTTLLLPENASCIWLHWLNSIARWVQLISTFNCNLISSQVWFIKVVPHVLQVPAFNGSSHLRFPGLGDACSSWLELQLTIKPHTGDGVLLYNSQVNITNIYLITLFSKTLKHCIISF